MSTIEESAIDWKELVSEWLISGLSQTKFCEQRGLKSHQLSYYYRKYYPADEAPAKLASVAVSAGNASNAVTSGFVLAFPTGVKLSVPSQFCQESLRRMLLMLKELA